MSRKCPQRKNAIFSTWLDRVFTISGFACPISVLVSLNFTYFWHRFDKTWTVTGQTLYMTFFGTYLGQGLDEVWTEVGFSVQSLSNQPSSSSTHSPYANAIARDDTTIQRTSEDQRRKWAKSSWEYCTIRQNFLTVDFLSTTSKLEGRKRRGRKISKAL